MSWLLVTSAVGTSPMPPFSGNGWGGAWGPVRWEWGPGTRKARQGGRDVHRGVTSQRSPAGEEASRKGLEIVAGGPAAGVGAAMMWAQPEAASAPSGARGTAQGKFLSLQPHPFLSGLTQLWAKGCSGPEIRRWVWRTVSAGECSRGLHWERVIGILCACMLTHAEHTARAHMHSRRGSSTPVTFLPGSLLPRPVLCQVSKGACRCGQPD